MKIRDLKQYVAGTCCSEYEREAQAISIGKWKNEKTYCAYAECGLHDKTKFYNFVEEYYIPLTPQLIVELTLLFSAPFTDGVVRMATVAEYLIQRRSKI